MNFVGILKTEAMVLGMDLVFVGLRLSVGSGAERPLKRRKVQERGARGGPDKCTLNAGCAFSFLWLWLPAAGSDMLQACRLEPGGAAGSWVFWPG